MRLPWPLLVLLIGVQAAAGEKYLKNDAFSGTGAVNRTANFRDRKSVV